MKILFVTEFFPTSDGGVISGGAESRTYYLSKNINNYDVYVVTSWLSRSLRNETWGILKIFRAGLNRNYVRKTSLVDRLFFGLDVILKIIKIKPDIIDANNGVVYFFAYLGAKMTGAKLVYWVPDVVGLEEWQKEQGIVGGLIARIMELIVVWFPADKIIALSYTTENKLLKLGIPKDNIKVIYPGV